MFTLKIKWFRSEDGKIVDETTLFIPAEQIAVHGEILSMDNMKAWERGTYQDYTIADNDGGILSSRLIAVTQDEHQTWYLVSRAWILGPTGSTIEKVAP